MPKRVEEERGVAGTVRVARVVSRSGALVLLLWFEAAIGGHTNDHNAPFFERFDQNWLTCFGAKSKIFAKIEWKARYCTRDELHSKQQRSIFLNGRWL